MSALAGDIAVVGAAGRFPDARGVDEFWRNVAAGVVSTRALPDDVLQAAGVPAETSGAPDYVRVVATLSDVDQFAADFFGCTAAEAELIDPQQRLFLEACWEALESAGHPPVDGPAVGVFGAASESTYTALLRLGRARAHGAAAALHDVELRLGGQCDFLTSRVAYKLGLRGPSVVVQTACSSSLTAVHYAALSLLAGQCDIALAGGCGFDLPFAGYRYQPQGILSRDGYCRAFDARSTGTAVGAAVGVVALRRLADALADGDPVLAVLRGSAVGNDGAARPGFTAPTPAGPATVAAAALAIAGIDADKLCYVEAHGSGTPLGDHVELVGLTQGLRRTTSRNGFCGLGSVKVNIGHADAAAGIAGLINAIHVVRTGQLPPHPLFHQPRDPGLLADSPFVISPVPRRRPDPDRHVLVSSMGLGGTNAAAVLGPPPPPARPSAAAGNVVRLVVSARTRRELDQASGRLADALDATTPAGAALADVAHTLRVGRRHFAERRVVTAPAGPDAAGTLAAALRLPRGAAVRTVRTTPRRALVVPGSTLDGTARATLAAAFGGRVDTAETAPDPVPPGVLVLRLSQLENLDEALYEAWLNGVPVDWTTLDGAAGRRVRLPTYPFARRRYWALDQVPSGVAVTEAAESTETVDSTEAVLVALWRELFGVEKVGLDDEFGVLGGTSLLAVRMALEIQRRTGVLVDLHRVGGSRATVRRIAAAVRAAGNGGGGRDDGALVDADLTLPLGPIGPAATGSDTLLTGGSGFLGAFLLRELLDATSGRVYCFVRAQSAEHGWARLRDAARRYRLPEPDPGRVRAVAGDLRDVERVLERVLDKDNRTRVGHVVHAAARVDFTEPYRVLRPDVLGTAGLLRWMRARGVADLSYVSSLAACGPALGTAGVLRELPDQPLDPAEGGYGTVNWVCERLVGRAGRDGMRVRVFRPGLVLGARTTGACNPRDLVWRVVAAGLAVGAHPADDQPLPVAPVDLVARAVVEIGRAAGSAGRVYHLVDTELPTLRGLFAMLAGAGLPTACHPPDEWHRLVADRALSTSNEALSTVALYAADRRRYADVESGGWQGWLASGGRSAGVDGAALRASLRYLATQPGYEYLWEVVW